MNTIDLLIVGAGPVGLFCANEAARHGLTCQIVDKKTALSEHSKALGIHIRTLDVLEDCGFIDDILKQGHPVEGVIFKSEHQELLQANFNEIKAHRQFLIDLPQNKTEKIFYEALEAKGIDVQWNTELCNLSQTNEGVTATLKHSDNSIQHVQARWLIACDGAHSTTRKLLKVDFNGAAYEKTWWLADLMVDWMVPANHMVIYLHQKGPLACFPMGNKRYRLVMMAPEGHELEPSLHDIQEAFSKRSSDLAQLSNPFWLGKFNIHHRQINNYRAGSVFFAGDAAHIHSPMGGQGLNTGIQDIYNLIWKLALVQKNQARPELLDSYHIERHPIGKAVLKKTDIMTRMVLLSNAFTIKLRNACMKFFFSIESMRKKIIQDLAELRISYARSPTVSHKGQLNGLKAGTYCPEFHLYNPDRQAMESSVDFLRGTKHHLFLFSGPEAIHHEQLIASAKTVTEKYKGLLTVHHVLSELQISPDGQDKRWLDKDQKIHRQFAINQAALILIRPDKYIGLIQHPIHIKQLSAYFDKWFMSTV